MIHHEFDDQDRHCVIRPTYATVSGTTTTSQGADVNENIIEALHGSNRRDGRDSVCADDGRYDEWSGEVGEHDGDHDRGYTLFRRCFADPQGADQIRVLARASLHDR